MLTPAGPKVLEFNVRFGDPECQPLIALLESDLIELLWATATATLHKVDVKFSDKASVCVVLASKGYPENPETGDVITGVDDADAINGVTVFHAGTKLMDNGFLVTAGGRVLSITATADTIELARDLAYQAVDKIHFAGMQVRNDIALNAPAHS